MTPHLIIEGAMQLTPGSPEYIADKLRGEETARRYGYWPDDQPEPEPSPQPEAVQVRDDYEASLPEELLNAPVAFGLRAQGKLQKVKDMLACGKSWDEIGDAIGWLPSAAKEHYDLIAEVPEPQQFTQEDVLEYIEREASRAKEKIESEFALADRAQRLWGSVVAGENLPDTAPLMSTPDSAEVEPVDDGWYYLQHGDEITAETFSQDPGSDTWCIVPAAIVGKKYLAQRESPGSYHFPMRRRRTSPAEPGASKYHTIEGWDKPRDGIFTIVTDAWWCVDAFGNPLFFDKHNYPQCNSNRAIAERIANGRNVKQLPIVYIPLRIHDYQ